jgi:hypothetical protein
MYLPPACSSLTRWVVIDLGQASIAAKTNAQPA